MKSIVAAAWTATVVALIVGGAGAAAAATPMPCYLPAEVEADQAVQFQIELMLIGETCKDPSYIRFLERNRDTVTAYQQILIERFAREGGAVGEAAEESFENYLTRLANRASLRASRTPSYCAASTDAVALANALQQDGLRIYAATQALTARRGYALCTAAGGGPVEAPGPNVAVDDLPGASRGGAAGITSLDPTDRVLAETTQRTLETARSGQPVAWQSPAGRAAGTITVTRTFRTAGGQWCREFRQSLTAAGGETRQASGTACRRPDGRGWDIQP